VSYDGQFAHRDGDHPESRGVLHALLDTRSDTVRFDTRLDAAPLAFDGIRPSYPGIPVQGSVEGPIAVRGTTDRFFTDSRVSGELGALEVRGTIARAPGRLVAESLTTRFTGLDLARLRGAGPTTRLAGALEIHGSFDSLTGPDGLLALDLDRSRIGALKLDTLRVRARASDGALRLDTLEAGWPGGGLAAAGRLRWQGEESGAITGGFSADSLAPFEALLGRLTGPAEDSVDAADSLVGRVTGEVELSGTGRAPRLLVRARGERLGWRGIRVPTAAAALGWRDADRPEIGGAVRADSVLVGRWRLEDLDLALGGYQDSLRWGVQGRLAGLATVGAAGSYFAPGDSQLVRIDSLVAALPGHDWSLTGPAGIALAGGRVRLAGVTLAASDGSGVITVSGQLPRAVPGDLTISAVGVDLRDVYTLLELDTAGIAGSIQLDVAVGGTARAPTLQGTGSLSDLAVGELGSPFVQGIVNYANRRLDANLLLWRTGAPVLRVESQLPLDLALVPVPRRQVDGPLRVRAVADSTDLGVLEVFTRNLRRVRGTLRADVAVEGTWNTPRLAGTIEIRDASAQVPGLGVRYQDLHALAHLAGDSVTIDSLVVQSGEGSMRVLGGLRLERLTRPVLDLSLRARRFRVIDTRRFLTLDATGTVQITGPVFGARLTGRVTADAGNLHFADLITKRIVDLENPGDSGLIDLDLVRTERLGANFQSRFLDSLAIDTLQIRMGESFWLRSNEANIQLDGDLTVEKAKARYRYDGTLNALRGSYTLRIGGFVTRDFTVERGAVRYFGTPDLNADLDIEARHEVIAAETSEEIPVIARITGTMLQPKLELSSPPTSSRPALSQTELVSYLMFSRPTFSLQGQTGQGSQYAAVQTGLSYLSSALSSEIQRTLITDLGVPIDYLDIRTGGAGAAGIGGQAGAAQVAQVAAGWQIGRRWFVTLVADLCTNAQRFYPSAEFRMTRQLRLKTAVEPAYSCQVALNQPALSVNKYQVGLDVLWEREY
jgi:autotransporter translocation and assembly factor TamB